ncbi:DUF202 domain-containing protein [Rhodobacteraceae bacterium CCMM004]|nr:DUF202 domain-containing protein [Rhodobacteraceae bacterium CCMM004]
MADKQALAEERTDWAEDRTILANERTFAGWMRTGLACVAVALGLKAVFGDFQPDWLPRLVANLFCVIGIAIFWMARRNACRTTRRMDEHDTESQSTLGMTLTAAAMALGAAATGAILWWL